MIKRLKSNVFLTFILQIFPIFMRCPPRVVEILYEQSFMFTKYGFHGELQPSCYLLEGRHNRTPEIKEIPGMC